MNTRIRAAVCCCFSLSAFAFSAHAQDTPNEPIPSALITAAHSIFLSESGATPGHEDATFQILRATLDSTHRFALLPSTHGADLVLLFGQIPGRTVPPTQAALLVLQARDPHSFANLGTLQAPWAVLPSLEKDQQAVTRLLDALFALDHGGAPASFTVASVPVNALTESLTTPLSILKAFIPRRTNPDAARDAAAAHKVLIVADPIPSSYPTEYRQTAAEFQADLTAANRYQSVTTLDAADLILRIGSYSLEDDQGNVSQYIAVFVLDPISLAGIDAMIEPAKTGKPKRGKPPLFQTQVDSLEKKFESSMASMARKAPKA